MKSLDIPTHYPAPTVKRFAGSEVKVLLHVPADNVTKLKTVEVRMGRVHAAELRDALTKLLEE